ncbi:hypothetical protein SAMN05421636_107290 [Pricia antarctica]|uniref:Uncharacterized protein n=1 Tax=Pricia antarctica TaxID=641691 RepID=A0A1G7FV61_9FLAO|nr:hypothetical protein SAMN05421636_107290 [Pricia antarctica]
MGNFYATNTSIYFSGPPRGNLPMAVVEIAIYFLILSRDTVFKIGNSDMPLLALPCLIISNFNFKYPSAL